MVAVPAISYGSSIVSNVVVKVVVFLGVTDIRRHWSSILPLEDATILPSPVFDPPPDPFHLPSCPSISRIFLINAHIIMTMELHNVLMMSDRWYQISLTLSLVAMVMRMMVMVVVMSI